MKFLSIIIPAYNEEKRIKKTLLDLQSYLRKQDFEYEVIIVDDGSTDKTKKRVEEIIRDFKNFRLAGYGKNKGKGAAIKHGVFKSQGDYILFMDADGSTPPAQFETFKPCMGKYPIIIGSRHLEKGYIKRKQPPLRILVARLSNLVIRIVLDLDYSDTQCGFKLFEKEVAHQLFSKMVLQRWGFDFEILAIAKKYGILTKEVPVIWYNEESSRVKFGAIFKTFWELFRVRWNLWTGKY